MRLARKILITSSVFYFLAFILLAEDNPESRKINIFFTGDVQGNFEPCGCAGGPTGGIARRVGFCDQYSKENSGFAIHIDAGNYFASPGPDSTRINNYLKKSLQEIPLRVMNLGADDLYWWKELSQLPEVDTKFISTNLVPRRSNLAAPDRFAIIEIPADKLGTEKPIRIGFVGLVDPGLVKPNSGFRGIDPLKSFRDIKSELVAKTDFIVVLWDLIRPQNSLKGSIIGELVNEHKEIYTVITTEKRFILYDPVQINSAVVLSGIERGRYLGLLSFGLDSNGEVTTVSPEFFEMHDQVPEDGYLAGLERKISKLNH